jgi:repressor LexA
MTRPNQMERIYAFIEKEYKRNGFSPSISEIASFLSLTAKSNIHRQLQQLVSEGRLQNLGGRYVPARLRENGAADVVLVPLIGKVAAGQPITAIENLEGYVAYLPRFGDGNELFALTIKGDSMTGAGIFDSDIVIVEKTPVVQNGEIAVALIEEEATVKTFYREKGHIRLQPENPDYEPIIVEDVAILGSVIASMRYHKNRRLYK